MLPSSPIELAVKDLLPGAKIQLAVGDRRHHLASHDGALEVGIAVVLAGVVVLVAADRFKRCQLLQPAFKIRQQSAFIIIDKHAGGDIHRIHQAQPLADAALAQAFLHLRGDVHETAPVGQVKP